MAQPFRVRDGDDPGRNLGGWDDQGNVDIPGTLTIDTIQSSTTPPQLGTITFRSMVDFVQAALSLVGAAASSDVLTSEVSGDTVPRLVLDADGTLRWGSGSATQDTSFARASTAQLRVTPTANASASSSVGGALNITNTSSTGAGLVVYSTQAAPSGHLIVSRVNNATFNQAAIYAEYTGTSHAVSINHQGTGAASSALNVTSNNTAHSALGVTGVETGRGTIKVSHTGTGTDANASAISIDLEGAGTAAQGIFVTATGGGTTGNLLELRNGGTGALFNVSSTGVVGLGSGTGAPDVTFGRTAANEITFNDYTVMAASGQSSGTFSIFSNGVAALDLGSAGGGIAITEGANARMGVSTLVAGTVTVANTSVTANTRIFLTSQTSGAAPGAVRVSARVAATSFTITSTNAGDTSDVAWLLVEPS